MKTRYLNISIGVKMLVAFTLLFGVLFFATYTWFLNLATGMALDDIERELGSIAQAVANNINGDDFSGLVQSDLPSIDEMLASQPEGELAVTDQPYYNIQDERYRDMVDTLSRFRQMSGRVVDLQGQESWRLGIYTYVATETTGTVNYIGSASAANNPPGGARFRSEYVTQPRGNINYMWTGLNESIVNVRNAIPDEYGTWYSGFAPIRDSEGNAVGAVGVDMRDVTVQLVEQQIRNAVLPVLAVLLVVLFIAVLLISYGITRPIAALTRAAQRVGEGDYSEGVIPPVRGVFRDETATLNQVFEMMVDKVRERTESLKQKISELQIMVDETKKDQHVREIVDSDFFRELQAKSAKMRNRARPSGEAPIEPTPES
jgi:HAMP domain-containing protein